MKKTFFEIGSSYVVQADLKFEIPCGEKRNPCTLLVGMQAGVTILEK
jgi:hypothetical protein